jgi:2',3'-cyclic-nucleotide 2'-phosphodiesterase (5'-nucleotidase family)
MFYAKYIYHILLFCFAGWFISCSTPLQITQHSAQYIAIDSAVVKDSAIDNLMLPYRTEQINIMQTLIGNTTTPLSKTQPESSLGNFMCDAQLYYAKQKDAKTVAAIINYGAIRIPYISPGPLTVGTIYELMPFDNTLVIVEVPGKVLKQFCDHMAALGGWPTANLSFEITDKKASNILIDNKPIHDFIVYKIALSDYIANGGDNCSFLLSCKKTAYAVFIRDLLIDYVKEKETIHAKIERRVYYGE